MISNPSHFKEAEYNNYLRLFPDSERRMDNMNGNEGKELDDNNNDIDNNKKK